MINSSILNRVLDINNFNNILVNGGGEPIITKKKLMTMRNFISVLLKLFKKDYDMKYNKKKGGNSLDGYSHALSYGNLNYSNQFQFPLFGINQRSIV